MQCDCSNRTSAGQQKTLTDGEEILRLLKHLISESCDYLHLFVLAKNSRMSFGSSNN